MSVPFVIWLIIFKYIPLWGWTMAFQEAKTGNVRTSDLGENLGWFKNFTDAFKDRLFTQTLINTLGVSFLDIAVICGSSERDVLYEVQKVTQTISYLPHFVSWVVIASIAKNIFNDGGVVDSIFGKNLHLMKFQLTAYLGNHYPD